MWKTNWQSKTAVIVNIYNRHLYQHTFIIGHYKPSIRIIGLVSHTNHVVCVNRSSLTSTPNDKFFETLFRGWFLFTLRIYSEEIFFVFSYWCLTWSLNLGLTSNKPTHYLQDWGDFIILHTIYLIKATSMWGLGITTPTCQSFLQQHRLS